MDIASLKAFVAVAESGSFSSAAERLYMTQPAVSKRVAALESDLEVALFDRLGRGIQLTEAGQTFLISARRILNDISISREELRSLSADVGGRLCLATSHHIGIHRLPPILKTFTQTYPRVELDLKFMDSELACAEVEKGPVELAVVTLPEPLTEALDASVVWPDPLHIVCSLEHPFAQEPAVTPEMLGRHKAVLPARGTVTRDILLRALKPHRVSVSTALETNYLETIKMMVSVGLGWSALPSRMVDQDILSVNTPALNMERQLGSVQRKGRTLSRAALAFLNTLRVGPR